MTKFITLLTAAHVGGLLRHPHEGVLHVADDEADRLIADQVATDVSADFTAKQDAQTPVDKIVAEPAETGDAEKGVPHQSQVAPQEADEPEPKPKARKAAASKE